LTIDQFPSPTHSPRSGNMLRTALAKANC
jgi:hypothetical protein